MITRIRAFPSSKRAILVSLALLPIWLFSARAALADSYPSIQPGLWHFHRTVEDSTKPGKPMVLDKEKCGDPLADMKAMHDKLVKMGCKFSPTSQSGNVYHFSLSCDLPQVKGTSITDLRYESPTAYEAEITFSALVSGTPTKTHEVLTAKRLGDCP